MAYHTLYVCDACHRPPNGNSPDCVYSHESYPQFCDCAIHDLCDECMGRQRKKIREGRTTEKCLACERQERYNYPPTITANYVIAEMLPYVEHTYECIHPDQEYNDSIIQLAKSWLENHS